LVTGFGENSIDLELRFWIDDPSNGVGNIRSEVLLGIWDRFKENGVNIPFPQRDVRIIKGELS
jgi:small-conductance mechanosensitive channel